MEFLKYTLMAFLIYVAIQLVYMFINKNKIKEEKKLDTNIVKTSKIYLIIGLICLIFFIALFILCLVFGVFKNTNTNNGTMFICINIFIIIIPITLILYQINWRIEYNDESFRYRTIFGHTIEYSYSDIVEIKKSSNDILIKAKNRWLVIDFHAVGIDGFIKILNKNNLYIN